MIIRTEYDSGTDTATLTVQDDGPGFDADQIDRIFEPYVSSKEKGTGLGLAICRRIIEEHGGTIRASNAQSAGAAVIISLPLRRR
ncbi:MAG: hypothetical protein CL387_04770 [Acidiferrobacter sp.]|nr:hypothetical protein [Acidiferrobacter sp.]